MTKSFVRAPDVGDNLSQENSEARPRAQLPLQKLEPLGAVEGARRAAYARERLLHVAPDARELGHRGVDVVGAHGVGQVAVAHEVRDALAHLVVEDPVVLFGEPGGGALPGSKKTLRPTSSAGMGAFTTWQLHVGVRREVVDSELITVKALSRAPPCARTGS